MSWKSRYRQVYDMFIPANAPVTPIKIAILDTGIDLSHSDFDARAESVKDTYNWLNARRPRAVHDRDGHGTFVAGLLLDYAPDADLYVAKIADGKPSDPRIIAKVWKESSIHVDDLADVTLREGNYARC